MDIVSRAEGLLHKRLHGCKRYDHSISVYQQAQQALSQDSELLEQQMHEQFLAACLLHDIGYSDPGVHRGNPLLHPFVGAYLLWQLDYPPKVLALVEHHGDAYKFREQHSLAVGAFNLTPPQDALRLLDYFDRQTLLCGAIVSWQERLADIEQRHGTDSPQASMFRQTQAEHQSVQAVFN